MMKTKWVTVDAPLANLVMHNAQSFAYQNALLAIANSNDNRIIVQQLATDILKKYPPIKDTVLMEMEVIDYD